MNYTILFSEEIFVTFNYCVDVWIKMYASFANASFGIINFAKLKCLYIW